LQAFAGKKNCMAELDRPETPEGYFRSRNHISAKRSAKSSPNNSHKLEYKTVSATF
jgi:hypothetical protein